MPSTPPNVEDEHHNKLEVHAMISIDINEVQFYTNGRAALKIGQHLEMAESEKELEWPTDTASLLIRQWLIMECRVGGSKQRRAPSERGYARILPSNGWYFTSPNFSSLPLDGIDRREDCGAGTKKKVRYASRHTMPTQTKRPWIKSKHSTSWTVVQQTQLLSVQKWNAIQCSLLLLQPQSFYSNNSITFL